MAFHLSLADVHAARQTAERSFERIEFRLYREKLNVAEEIGIPGELCALM